jgi:hypothetical protein
MVALPTSPAGFPMAPSAEAWEALSPAERADVVAALPGEVDKDRLRFYAGRALLLESEEFVARVQEMYDDAQRRAEEESRLREEAERLREEADRRREEAERRREEAEQENARLRAEIERLKR